MLNGGIWLLIFFLFNDYVVDDIIEYNEEDRMNIG